MRVDGAFRQGVGLLAILLGLTLAVLSSYCLYNDELLAVHASLRTRNVYELVRDLSKDKNLDSSPTRPSLEKLEPVVKLDCGAAADSGRVGQPVLLTKCGGPHKDPDRKAMTVQLGSYTICRKRDAAECTGGGGAGEAQKQQSQLQVSAAGAAGSDVGVVGDEALKLRDAEITEDGSIARTAALVDGLPSLQARGPQQEHKQHPVRDMARAASMLDLGLGLDEDSRLLATAESWSVFGKLESGNLVVPLKTRGGDVLVEQMGEKTFVDIMQVVETPAPRTLPVPAMLALLFLGVVAFLLGASEIPIASFPSALCCRVPIFSTCSLALINTMALLLAGVIAGIMVGSAWCHYSGLLSLPFYAGSFTCLLLLLFVRVRCGADMYDDDDR